jgi:agmatine deiminase
MSPESRTPAQLGYRWPAEWEPHTATWLSWPHNPDTWPGRIESIPPVWAELVRVLCEHETVNILAGGDAVMRQAEQMVGGLTNVVLHDIPTNDAWIRDHGPVFLQHAGGGEPALVDWQYNAWGGKYPPFDKDNVVPAHIAASIGMRRFVADIILEPGAIDGNGNGTVLASETCLLNPNRNPDVSRDPGLSRDEVERYLATYLGVQKVLWLAGELVGDDTDGHVDQTARFVGPRTVVVAVERDTADANYASLAENFERLRKMTDQDGHALKVIEMPMPGPVFDGDVRLPASYCNFYIANGIVIVPQFDDPADSTAIEILAEIFPDRRIVGVQSVDLVCGLGAFHCITQQQPA